MKFSISTSASAASARTCAWPSALSSSIATELLAAVAGMEIGGGAVGGEGRAPLAGVVAGPGTLDLDDVRAEIGEQLPGPGPGEDPGQLDHLQAGEGLVHQKAGIPVIARPRIRPWTSCVPS